ncbi:MAG: threonine aldolase [Clostridiales bacterium GWF2_38_85]|nr:MAG: threonine aldolase [Clostridiales bacterium GWF2_38_85]HBL84733.1 low specificity L-threonine aldolase [Clostridiales bacterium]
MIRFESDYLEGCHPEILKLLNETNLEQTIGYGEDEHCANARKLIKSYCKDDILDVHFLTGGTQVNLTLISAALRTHQGVITAFTGHIFSHETGAIEAVGHRLLPVTSPDGKITAAQIAELCEAHYSDCNRVHTVQPGMVYISNPTENGTIYQKNELVGIRNVCNQYNLLLYMDGARLGYGLMSDENDLTLEDISKLCDAFYIGGTKVGALFGEALVIRNDNLKRDFKYIQKQHGGMLAKGRLLGIQFEVLFTNDLYFRISKHTIQQANILRDAFKNAGYRFFYKSPTNQLFPIIHNEKFEKLSEKYSFSFWGKVDETHSAVRFCTSWATKAEDIIALVADI